MHKVLGGTVSDADDRGLRWRKSTKSAQSACIEVARMERAVFVRDSKDRGGPVVGFTRSDWSAFVGALHGDDLDLDLDGAPHAGADPVDPSPAPDH